MGKKSIRAASSRTAATKRKRKSDGSPSLSRRSSADELVPPTRPTDARTPEHHDGSPPHDSENQPPFIVGIGASAGGLSAFEQFFKEVSVDSNLVYVVVPHLHPNHESILPDLLAKYTNMPVVRISDGDKLE